MKRVLVLGMILLLGLTSFGVWRVFLRPRDRGFGPVGGIRKVAGNVYLIGDDAGGNTAVFVTKRGVVLVDTKVANRGKGILEEVRKVTDKPVTHIINTHSHGDHTGSNAFFPAQVEIVSQENTAKNMSRMSNFVFGLKKDALPDHTYREKLTLFSDADAVDLYYFGPAHTNGDTFVVFRADQVMHAGDVFAAKGIPVIDEDFGGSAVQFGDTVRRAVAGIRGVRTVITGHAGVMEWVEFVEYSEFVDYLVNAARTAHEHGQTVEQAAQGVHTPPDKFKGYDLTETAGLFTSVYSELPNNNAGGWARASRLLSAIIATP
jgi:glyoxylase-like metal-dependent hydrolase (beta-lactamase superfamily II)